MGGIHVVEPTDLVLLALLVVLVLLILVLFNKRTETSAAAARGCTAVRGSEVASWYSTTPG